MLYYYYVVILYYYYYYYYLYYYHYYELTFRKKFGTIKGLREGAKLDLNRLHFSWENIQRKKPMEHMDIKVQKERIKRYTWNTWNKQSGTKGTKRTNGTKGTHGTNSPVQREPMEHMDIKVQKLLDLFTLCAYHYTL